MNASFTTVVTGVPRSGTSLAMQMLAAGGMPILSDLLRAPDADNPRGYFELDLVKQLPADPSSLPPSEGMAVKVIHLLLPHLPQDRAYRVIVMHRDFSEVVLSQGIMLERRGTSGGALSPERMAAVLAQQMARLRLWCNERPDIPVLEIEHSQVLAQPLVIAGEINRFLGLDMEVSNMASVIDPALYRCRA
jgi:hypothetical protein